MLFLANSHSQGNSGIQWRPIFPGESCLSMPKSGVWLDALENPNCTALLRLSGVRWAPERLWPPHYAPKIANCFPKRCNIRNIPAVCLLLRFIFWTQHSNVLVFPILFKGNTKKEEYGSKPTTGKQLHTCHASYRWYHLQYFKKSYHPIKFNILSWKIWYISNPCFSQSQSFKTGDFPLQLVSYSSFLLLLLSVLPVRQKEMEKGGKLVQTTCHHCNVQCSIHRQTFRGETEAQIWTQSIT